MIFDNAGGNYDGQRLKINSAYHPRVAILTRPLALQLAEILKDDTASWKEQKITLYPEPIHVAGRACVAIRARSVL